MFKEIEGFSRPCGLTIEPRNYILIKQRSALPTRVSNNFIIMTHICDIERGKNTNVSITYIKGSKQEY